MRSKGKLGLLAAIVPAMIVSACGGGGGSAPAASSGTSSNVSAPQASLRFADVTSASNISFEVALAGPQHSVARTATFGGVAAGDYDNDGDIDLFITRGKYLPNLLYRNEGNLRFVDVAAAAGLANTLSATENHPHSGPVFADMDGDGDLDLFMGVVDDAPSHVFQNNGDGSFSDVTAGSGIDTLAATNTISAAFGDYDLDGDLDMFLAHWGTTRDQVNPGDTENLWENISAGSTIAFRNVTVAAGISPSIITLPDPLTSQDYGDWTFTPTFARIDNDLYPDILSVADFNYSQYFRNNGDGTFTNATDPLVLTDDNGMGSAIGDYDNDGDLDWFVSSIMPEPDAVYTDPNLRPPVGNRLYRNDDGSFTDVTDSAGVASGGWGWGACFIDFENDGDLDIYHTNGWTPASHDWGDFTEDPSRAFVATGSGVFINRAPELGIESIVQGRAVVCADFDNDGDIDVFEMHNSPGNSATLWENTRTSNNFLRISLTGTGMNTEAAGARIFVTTGARTQMREITIGNNFTSQNPAIQVIGLGSFTQADEVRVEWPDGTEIAPLTNVLANQTLEFSQ